MIKLVKITAYNTLYAIPIEARINEFLQDNQLKKSDIVHVWHETDWRAQPPYTSVFIMFDKE